MPALPTTPRPSLPPSPKKCQNVVSPPPFIHFPLGTNYHTFTTLPTNCYINPQNKFPAYDRKWQQNLWLQAQEPFFPYAEKPCSTVLFPVASDKTHLEQNALLTGKIHEGDNYSTKYPHKELLFSEPSREKVQSGRQWSGPAKQFL